MRKFGTLTLSPILCGVVIVILTTACGSTHKEETKQIGQQLGGDVCPFQGGGVCPAWCESCAQDPGLGDPGGDPGGLPGDPAPVDGQYAMRDYCGGDEVSVGLLSSLCGSGTTRQWSHCYTSGSLDDQGRDVGTRVQADSDACQAGGGQYFQGASSFVYTPASCCM
jgi:hypothetical protein